MKTLQKTILALSFAFTTTYTFAQTAYEKAMMPKVQTIEMPKPNPDDYTAQANDFARIGDKEKTLWQPYYYAAFSLATVLLRRFFYSKKRKNTDATKPNCTTRRSRKRGSKLH